MPRRKIKTMRTTPSRDIEAIRKSIVEGVPWLNSERHYDLTRGLTAEQRALLSHLTPFRSAAKFICDLNPDLIAAARQVLKGEITAAEGKWGARNKRSKLLRRQLR